MCGRLFTKHEDALEILATLGLPWVGVPELNNQTPGEQLPFIYMSDGKFAMSLMRWGLHPQFAKAPPTSSSTTHNARIETVQTLPTYRHAIKHQRGFVPASGFIEWRNVGHLSEPFFIYCDEQPLALAGIWEIWNNEILSFSIITQPANEIFAQVHARMPLSLTREQIIRWCDPNENVHELLQEFQGHSLPLRFQPVSFDVNNARNKGPVDFVDNHPKQAALL